MLTAGLVYSPFLPHLGRVRQRDAPPFFQGGVERCMGWCWVLEGRLFLFIFTYLLSIERVYSSNMVRPMRSQSKRFKMRERNVVVTPSAIGLLVLISMFSADCRVQFGAHSRHPLAYCSAKTCGANANEVHTI